MSEKIVEVIAACPICGSNVKGNDKYSYYCEKCNMKFRRDHLLKSEELHATKQIIRESGYLYFIDKEGDVSRVEMASSRADKGLKVHEKIAKVGIVKEKSYFYYLDKEGFISKKKMQRKGKD